MQYLFNYSSEALKIVILDRLDCIDEDRFNKIKWYEVGNAYVDGSNDFFSSPKISASTRWVVLRNQLTLNSPTLVLTTRAFVDTEAEIHTGKELIDSLVNPQLKTIAPSLAILERYHLPIAEPDIDKELALLAELEAGDKPEIEAIAE